MSFRSPLFYSSIASNSTDLVSVLDEQGNYLYVGTSGGTVLGYEATELLGTSAFAYIHPEDREQAADCLQAAQNCDSLQAKPLRFRAKGGEWRWLQCTVTNMVENEAVGGFVTNSRDITEIVEAEYNRDYHQAHYKALFFEHPEAVFTLDTAGYLRQINRHVPDLTGYPAAEIIGSHFHKFVLPADTPVANEAFSRALSGEAHTVEVSIWRASSGDHRALSVTLVPVLLRGEVTAIHGIARDITETKQAQRLVQEQTEQLNNIINSIPEPFFALDSAWRYTFANEHYAAFTGRKRHELIGKVIRELQPLPHPGEFYTKCEEVMAQKETLCFEHSYTKDNQQHTLHFAIFPTNDGVAVHFSDITMQKVTQQELEKLSLVASKTINGVVILDPEGRIEWVNDGFHKVTGYTREEATGKTPGALLQGPETSKETASRILENYRKRVHFKEEILNYKKSGERYWVCIDVTPIFDSNGELVNYIAIQTDITEKKAAEAELVKMADDLYKHNLHMQQFTYIVSHNLRAPVANALGLANLAKRIGKDAPAYDGVLDRLQTSVAQLDHVIKDISNILRLRDSYRNATREEVSLAQVLQEVLQNFEEEIRTKDVKVSLEVDQDFALPSSKAYLYSIFYNLVSNAIKYRSLDRTLELQILAEKDRRGYVVSVGDNGLGMDMHLVQHQLFKLYKRFHPNMPGKGIGLFLVKTQVEAIGGKITVDSAPGIGTTFKIYLGAKHHV